MFAPDPEGRICRQEDPEIWFSSRRSIQEKAKRLCLSCPVVAACLEETLEIERQLGCAMDGTRGATFRTERERVLLNRSA